MSDDIFYSVLVPPGVGEHAEIARHFFRALSLRGISPVWRDASGRGGSSPVAYITPDGDPVECGADFVDFGALLSAGHYVTCWLEDVDFGVSVRPWRPNAERCPPIGSSPWEEGPFEIVLSLDAVHYRTDGKAIEHVRRLAKLFCDMLFGLADDLAARYAVATTGNLCDEDVRLGLTIDEVATGGLPSVLTFLNYFHPAMLGGIRENDLESLGCRVVVRKNGAFVLSWLPEPYPPDYKKLTEINSRWAKLVNQEKERGHH